MEVFSKRKCPRGRQWWLVIALSVLLVWFPNVAAQEASPIPIGEEAISAVACTSTVYGGNPISVRVDLSAPAFRPYNMRLTPSLPRLFEMHQDGTIGWLLYSAGDTFQAAQVPTIAVPDDALVQITFDLFPSGYISPDVLSTATCDVFIIGTHDPTPTPTIAGESPTPAPTRTPVATATVPPGSPLRLLRAQTGSRSGSPSRVSVCLVEPAPIGGLTVHLASSRPLTIPVPATIAISQGRDCKSLIVTPATVRSNTPVILTATLGPVTLAATTMVRPSRPAIYMQTASRAGGLSKVTLCDSAIAPAQGTAVTLASDGPTVFPVPDVAVIPAGSACRSLVISVGTVETAIAVTVTATFPGGVRTGSTVVRRMVTAAGT